MPTGEPNLSTDPNLDNYFEIVFISIDTTKFAEDKIRYPMLPIRKNNRMYNVLGN